MPASAVACAVLALALLLPACGLPRDPEASLEQAVARGALVAGLGAPAEHAAEEVELVEAFARSLGLGVQWREGSTRRLMEQLERRELDLVVAEVAHDDPWGKRVALSARWRDSDGAVHVVALPPGENRLLTTLDRFVIATRPAP